MNSFIEPFPITVDTHFLAQALTSVMQMRGELEEEEYLIVNDLEIEDETGYLRMIVSVQRNVLH